MKRRAPKLLVLEPGEADRCRQLIEKRGAKKAAQALGVCDPGTLFKATARVGVSQLTVLVIRAHLERGL